MAKLNDKKCTIYLAGGCFWGMELFMRSLNGVIDVTSGYANGKNKSDAQYRKVLTGKTGFKEAVKVIYCPQKISLEHILSAYFYVIDPTVKNQQGHDVGKQYQTGIYYTDNESKTIVEKIVKIEKARHNNFAVEVEPLICFYPAEEHHQKYLIKNPGGYCHIPYEKIKLFKNLKIDPKNYPKPSIERIKEKLSKLEFQVTQENETEIPYQNEFWNAYQKGIYVDIVTGEPLFSSTDKFRSGCGWPAFSKPIEKPSIIELDDYSHYMHRIEVRSRTGNTHLGHVFNNDLESPNGIRYCINSASLRFVPFEEMEKEGYGYLLYLFN
jgi:peptide methionine sulfoxide reductase msrA/msrB